MSPETLAPLGCPGRGSCESLQLLGVRVWCEACCQFGLLLTPILGPRFPTGSWKQPGHLGAPWDSLNMVAVS